ncbi:alkylation response protein AidB-like acyl-CoA dehydrogenase [Pedobacter sp. UYEF25]
MAENSKIILDRQAAVKYCLVEIAASAAESDLPDLPPKKEFDLLAEAGLLKITLPGEDLDFNLPRTKGLLQLLKEIGKANLSIGRIYEGHINALHFIHLFGTYEQKKFWYSEVINHNALFSVWNTQANNGVVFGVKNNILEVKGEKTFSSGAAIVSYALVTGNIDTELRKGWQMMIVDMSKIGAERIDKSTWKTLGMKASGSYIVDFSGYKIQEAELLGEPGNYLKQPYFNGGAIRFAAVQLGGAEAIAEATISYLSQMNRTTDPLQNTRVANIMTNITSGNLWINQAGKNFDKWVEEAGRSGDLIAFANMTRTAIEQIGISVMKESNDCVGARGLMHPFPFERLNRDLTFYLRQPAPDATKLAIAHYFFEEHYENKPAR